MSGDSDSTILLLTMDLTEHIQQFEGIVHTSSLCSADPGDSRRFTHLLEKLHDLLISDARRRPVPLIPWKLDVFSAFSIRITIGDLVRRSSSSACHPVES